MMHIQDLIKAIDLEIGTLKEKAENLVNEAISILKKVKPVKGENTQYRPRKLWVRLKETAGYPTFSVIWSQIRNYHSKAGKIFSDDIARGNRYKLEQTKFFNCMRGYPRAIQDLLWSYEEQFGEIRHQVTLLSRARENLSLFFKKTNSQNPGGK
ncbi:MAG: conjugative transfer protein MobI(A/C) [Desulfobaccales bacterium]